MKKLTLYTLISVINLSIFGQEITLESCINYALENNKSLKEAELNKDVSELVKKSAFTNYFPNISASAVSMKANKGLIEGEIPEMNLPVYNGDPATLQTATQFAYLPATEISMLDYLNTGSVTAIQPVFAGGQIINGNKLAELGKEFSQHQLSIATEEVIAKTEYFYWTIVALEEKGKTLLSYEKLLEQLYSDVEVACKAGLASKSDLLKVQMEINKIKANKLKLNNSIILLKMTLSQHIGIEYSDDFSLVDSITEIDHPSSLYRNPDEALEQREEYQMLTKAVIAEKLQKKIVIGENLPQLAVGVTGMYLDVMENDNSYGMAFATLKIPISGWWNGSYKIKEHQVKVDIAQNSLLEKSELLKLQMEKAYRDLTDSYEQINVAKSSKTQAIEHFKIVKDNYDAGINNTADLLEAQAILQQAKNAEVDAKANYKIAQSQFLKVYAGNKKNL